MTPTELAPQNMRALQKANDARTAATRALDPMKQMGTGQGAAYLAGLLRDRHDEIGWMSVGYVVARLHRFGKKRTGRFLSHQGLRDNKQVKTLTDRQRHALADAIERIR